MLSVHLDFQLLMLEFYTACSNFNVLAFIICLMHQHISFSYNSVFEIVSSILSIMLIVVLLALTFGLIDIFAESIRRKKQANFRNKYASIYYLFKYRQDFWKTLYYPLILLQRIIYVFIAMYLSYISQMASVIVMIVVATLILCYQKLSKPFNHDCNNYLA